MDVLTVAYTDIGIRKAANEDSLLVKIADTPLGKVVLAIIADGMGGLSKGELASASVIRAFSDWFDLELPEQLATGDWDDIQYRWERMIKEQNHRIAEYGRSERIQLGTTLTALLVIGNQFRMIAHVGDSRVYRINEGIEILTDDQTVVGRDIKRGLLTPEQARKDPRRNVLLQCIGASRLVEPEYIYGQAVPGEVYVLCSDGFRHMISEEEIFSAFRPGELQDETVMEQRARAMVELNKQRQETDNISVLLVKFQ